MLFKTALVLLFCCASLMALPSYEHNVVYKNNVQRGDSLFNQVFDYFGYGNSTKNSTYSSTLWNFFGLGKVYDIVSGLGSDAYNKFNSVVSTLLFFIKNQLKLH